MLQSRATDEKGNVQPPRKRSGSRSTRRSNRFHNNSIQTWAVEADGSVKNVYALSGRDCAGLAVAVARGLRARAAGRPQPSAPDWALR